MKTEDFNYNLPEGLIAQTPLKNRDQSRLMVLDKATGEIEHKHFYDIIDYLEEGDVLVLNDTKVMPARLYGIKEETGSHIEILMLKEIETDTLFEKLDQISNSDRVIIIIETKEYNKKFIHTKRPCYICTYSPLEIVDRIN